jgi:hypothetical protein
MVDDNPELLAGSNKRDADGKVITSVKRRAKVEQAIEGPDEEEVVVTVKAGILQKVWLAATRPRASRSRHVQYKKDEMVAFLTKVRSSALPYSGER